MLLKQFINKQKKLPVIIFLSIICFISFNVINKNIFKNTRFDLTRSNVYTLSIGTKSVINSIKEPLNFKLFYTKQIGDANPVYQNYYNRVKELLEQYVLLSNNKIKLQIYNPEPFSDEEDQAVEFGLQGVEILQGVYGYFGLIATNSTDDEEKIVFFQADRDEFLEYDLSKIVANLANPNRRVVGLYTSIPIQGTFNPYAKDKDAATLPPWEVYNQLTEFFEVKRIHEKTRQIPDDLELIMIVHPKSLPERLLYMFDQFVMKGGKLLVFIDPNAETEKFASQQQNDESTNSSSLKKLLNEWGIQLLENKVVGDLLSARRVSVGSESQPSVTDYIAWLDIKNDNVNKNHQATSKVQRLTFATAGVLKKSDIQEEGSNEFNKLVWSTKQSMLVDSEDVRFAPDPTKLLRDFVPINEELVLAAEIKGNFNSNFEDGPPDTPDNFDKDKHIIKSIKPSTIIAIADVDMLYDEYWIKYDQSGATPVANNADFTVNLLEYLNGSEALIGLRGKGTISAPFSTVEKIRKEAEKKYRTKEQELLEKLSSYQSKLENIQSGKNEEEEILNEEESIEIEKFRSEMINVRAELRKVQNALRIDIEKLDSKLKFFNIFLVPILLIVMSIILGIIRRKKRHEKHLVKETT